MRSLTLAFFLVATSVHSSTPVATIISYHQILAPSTAATSGGESGTYTITPQQFDAQMDYLQQNGYHVVPLADLVAYIKGNLSSLPAKSVVITVDDGWQCVYTEMFPDLQHRQMPFTAFIFPAMIGYGKDYLTWPEVEEMAKAGVDIESHTFTHVALTSATQQSLPHELADSMSVIEQHTQKPVRFIAYPYSMYDAASLQAVQAAGYEAGLYDRDYGALITRDTPLMHLKRFPITRDTTLEKFKTFLLQ